MPSSTFNNLPKEKRQRVNKALVQEFSQHSLATAQVARVVNSAHIARGTFYKYFTDLIDAYKWILKVVMDDLQINPLDLVKLPLSADIYKQQVSSLMDRVYQSDYLPFLKMFYQTNEGVLDAHLEDRNPIMSLQSERWSFVVLCHETIKECLWDPNNKDFYIERLGVVLQEIIGGQDVSSGSRN